MRRKAYSTDLWRSGIYVGEISELIKKRKNESKIVWLPEAKSFAFNADPFGIWEEGCLYVFVEYFDYRVGRGEIHVYTYDAAFRLVNHQVALKRPFHLSYPLVFREGKSIYLLPEAHESGALTLYRARRFPYDWEVAAVLFEGPVIDPSLFRKEGRWWLFYSLIGGNDRAQSELHLASSDELLEGWSVHPNSPILVRAHRSRPAGTPFQAGNRDFLPLQDCSKTYGGKIDLYEIEQLSRDRAKLKEFASLAPEDVQTRYLDGLHTLSACGPVTLFDVKEIDPSSKRRWINLRRRFTSFLR